MYAATALPIVTTKEIPMEQFQETVQAALDNMFILAGIVLLVSFVSAKLADVIICRFLKTLAARTESPVDDELIGHVHKPLFISVFFFGVYLVLDILQFENPYRFLVLGILQTYLVIIWTGATFRVTKSLLHGLTRAANRYSWIDGRTLPLFDNLGKLFTIGLAIYLLLMVWELNVAPWLASAGIVGIALGFAAKDSLANLFGGLFIMADAPYKLGDFILLDTGERGRVTKIGLRSTRLLTRDDIEVTLPNAIIANSKIVNESGGPWEKARVTVHVGVAYGSDIDKVRRVLLEAAQSVNQVVDEPPPRIRFTEFGDSSLNFRLLCWIKEPIYKGEALDALNTQVYKRFIAEDIVIPFPQRDVHMNQAG
jgi:MscS family membrane protein